MRWFQFRRRQRPQGARRSAARHSSAARRLSLEDLETRTLLSATLTVVPSTLADKLTKFSTLADALKATHAGDTVQIEPGSAPGAGSVTLNNLTLQGDPADAPSALPQLGDLTIQAGVSGATLVNLNLGKVLLVNNSSHIHLTNSSVVEVDELPGTAGNGGNVFSGNTVTGSINLYGATGTTAAADQVLNNTFVNNADAIPYLFLQHDDSALVQGNFFTSTGKSSAAVEILDSQGVQVSNNVMHLGPQSLGVVIESPDTSASATVTNNRIDTGNMGTGIFVQKNTTGNDTSAVIAGNDLTANQLGIDVIGDGSRLPTTDAGGGGSSAGGNDFRGFTTLAGGRAAISTSNASSGTVSALGNLWSTGHPEHAVYARAGTSILVSTLPDANYTYVQTLYNNFLGRNGSQVELQAWVALLPILGTEAVANQIMHSPEALGYLVNHLYLTYLGRTVDSVGQATWVGMLQGGATQEQVLSAILSSPEFTKQAAGHVAAAVGTDVGFIQGLYQLLLQRQAGSAEVSLWLGVIQSGGRRSIIVAVLSSPECRAMEVRSYYAWLHRDTPLSDVEVNPWVNSSLDLMSIEMQVAGSKEFYANA